ncbi:MAG: hypothetical protein U0401_22510 [Anaerolineae bacterium]
MKNSLAGELRRSPSRLGVVIWGVIGSVAVGSVRRPQRRYRGGWPPGQADMQLLDALIAFR